MELLKACKCRIHRTDLKAKRVAGDNVAVLSPEAVWEQNCLEVSCHFS